MARYTLAESRHGSVVVIYTHVGELTLGSYVHMYVCTRSRVCVCVAFVCNVIRDDVLYYLYVHESVVTRVRCI